MSAPLAAVRRAAEPECFPAAGSVPARTEALRMAQFELMTALSQVRFAQQCDDSAAIEAALSAGEKLLAKPWKPGDQPPTRNTTVLGWITKGPLVIDGESGMRDLVCFIPSKGWTQYIDPERGDVPVTVAWYQELDMPPGVEPGSASDVEEVEA